VARLDVLDEFVVEYLDSRGDGHGGCIAQCADGSALDHSRPDARPGKPLEERQILFPSLAVFILRMT
jgi:hypothetical protein